MKKQRYKEGAFIKIALADKKFAYGRLLPNYCVLIYDYINISEEVSIDIIEKKSTLFYVGIYRDIVTKGNVEIIGFKELVPEDFKRIPPEFSQDLMNYKECRIYYYTGEGRDASPEECIGLERGSAWELDGLIERIEDYYQGKKNFNVELQKPILSENDIRYMPPPQTLKWDNELHQLYRSDLV